MEKQRLSYLLDLYLKKELSAEESDELNDWFHSISYGTDDLNKWIDEAGGQAQFISRFYNDFQSIIKKHQSQKNRRIIFLSRIGTAAIALIFLTVSLLIYSKKKSNVQNPVSSSVIAKTKKTVIVPGSSKAVLTLPNGKQIDLTNTANGKIVQTADVKITKTNDGSLLNQADNNHVTDDQYMVSTPNGGQYQVVLADGTHVWLNAASSLKYPSNFSGPQRKVELTGEAYFEVAHNKNMPFIVMSNTQKVEVLGTHFDVKAYEDESLVFTTLLEGSVKVNSLNSDAEKMLKPGEQSLLNNEKLTVKLADTKEVMAWKNGYFIFNDEDIHNIMKQISRWYNVKIVYNDDFKNKKFGAIISRNKSVFEILNMLELTNGIHFKIEDRRIIVMK